MVYSLEEGYRGQARSVGKDESFVRNPFRPALGYPILTSLASLLFVSSVSAATAAQDPHQYLRDWAASGRAEAIRELLSESEQVVVDSPDEAGWTALMHAANAGHETIVRLLLDAGASVHLENDAQATALDIWQRSTAGRKRLGSSWKPALTFRLAMPTVEPRSSGRSNTDTPRSFSCSMQQPWPALTDGRQCEQLP